MTVRIRSHDGTTTDVALERAGEGTSATYRVTLTAEGEAETPRALEVEIERRRASTGRLRIGGRVRPFCVHRDGDRVWVWLDGHTHCFEKVPRTARRATGSGAAGVEAELKAPMPGKILDVKATVGDVYEAHAPLIVMESMKMEMTISSPNPARVREILCTEGELVEMGALLARLEPPEPPEPAESPPESAPEMADLPERVQIVEVGPRDGLQNEAKPIPTERKIAFVEALAAAGLTSIEITSFVRPLAVPQLADAADVAAGSARASGVTYSALVPNLEGLERADAAGMRRIAVFTAASDTFAQRNINMTVERSLTVFREVIEAALARGISVRGYISTCFTCPYEGRVPKERVRDIAERLVEFGVDEVAVSDTIGAAAPNDIEDTVGWVLATVPRERIALHLHDTFGTALVNVYTALGLGITTFDASAGGLGGCPYAPGAAGNLATEDLVYMLDRLGITTGVDLERVFRASQLIAEALGRELPGRLFRRMQSCGS